MSPEGKTRARLSNGERWVSRMSGECHFASQLQLSWHFVPECGDAGAAPPPEPSTVSSTRTETTLTDSSTVAAEANVACRLTKQTRRRARSVLVISRHSSGE